MYSPGKRVCELCQSAEIGVDDEAFPIIFYPFTDEEMQKLALEFAASVQAPPGGILGEILPIAMPRGLRLEFCKKCTDGFIPMLDQLKAVAFDRVVERMRARAARNLKQKKIRPVFGGPDEDD